MPIADKFKIRNIVWNIIHKRTVIKLVDILIKY